MNEKITPSRMSLMIAFRTALCMALLVLTCIIFAVTYGSKSEKFSTTNLFEAATHADADDDTSSLQALRQSLPEVITKISSTRYRQLTSRDCFESGLLTTCPFGSGDNLFDGSCPGIQEKEADQWCFNGEKEVCCGISTSDCCVVQKKFVGIFVGIFLAIVFTGIFLCCAYCECCPCFRYLRNRPDRDEEQLQPKDNTDHQ